MNNQGTSPVTSGLRQQLALAEQYVQKILPSEPNAKPEGQLESLSIVTRISYADNGVRRLTEDDVFDGVLAAVVKAELPRLATLALARLWRAAKVQEQHAIQPAADAQHREAIGG